MSRKKAGEPKPRVRGRPFKTRHDPRRNLKGRGASPKRSPAEEVVDALMTRIPVTVKGRRRRLPKIRVVIDQQLAAATQGDQPAARVTASLIRAVKDLVAKPEAVAAGRSRSVHNEAALRRVMDDYDRSVATTLLGQKREVGDDEQD